MKKLSISMAYLAMVARALPVQAASKAEKSLYERLPLCIAFVAFFLGCFLSLAYAQPAGTTGGRGGFATDVELDPGPTAPRVVINADTPNKAQTLIDAVTNVSNPEQTVELGCGVEIDLTGRTGISIADNRSLIASPACARGPRSPGPRIFVTDLRAANPLFVIRGDNVRISGFRLEGPTQAIGQGSTKEKAILISPPPGAAPIRNIEISNMEIFHWSGLGIQVVDNVELAQRGRLFNTNVGAVHIFGNFFHHNRHGAGWGYGVDVGDGAYALIEQNVFDENRHAIAGGSKMRGTADFSGYTARDNLVLSGGGEHCSEGWWWTLTGWRFNCWKTHQFDMHGDQNEWYSDNNWLCGRAGETIIMERNTFLYTAGNAIKIRGNPMDKVVLDGNIFKAGSRSDAIAQRGSCGGFGDNITRPIEIRPNNAFGIDPMRDLGRCDFFGDGRLDDFMATGATWWARSPVTNQWRYLNTMPERLEQLKLEKFDGDNVCDVVLRVGGFSKSGTGPVARGQNSVASRAVDGMVLSTGNIYFTSHDATGAHVFRTGQTSRPGQEIELYREGGGSRFGDIVWANVGGNFFGYFWVQQSDGTSVIKRIPLAGFSTTAQTLSPPVSNIDIVNSHHNLTTDGHSLYWQDASSVRKMPIGGGPVTILDQTTTSTPTAGVYLRGTSLIYASGQAIRHVPTAGAITAAHLRTLVTASSGVTTILPFGERLYWGERSGAILMKASTGITTIKPPGGALATSIASLTTGELTWTQCGAGACEVAFRRAVGNWTSPTGARALGASTNGVTVFWGDEGGLRRYP